MITYLVNTTGQRTTGLDVKEVKVSVDEGEGDGKAGRLHGQLVLGNEGRVVGVVDAITGGDQLGIPARNAHGTNVLAGVLRI